MFPCVCRPAPRPHHAGGGEQSQAGDDADHWCQVPSLVPSLGSPSSSLASEAPHTQVEVLPGLEDEPEPELDNLSTRSSACDCPAHIHDRDTPLLIDKVSSSVTSPYLPNHHSLQGMSQAFSLLPAPAPVHLDLTRPTTAPPATTLAPLASLETITTAETGGQYSTQYSTQYTVHSTQYTAGDTAPSSPRSPGTTVQFAELPVRRSYSYGVLEKKWSL